MRIKNVKNMLFKVRFLKYVVFLIFLKEVIVLDYNQFCN